MTGRGRKPVLSLAEVRRAAARERSGRGEVRQVHAGRPRETRTREGMNKTEAAYADLLDARVAAGHVSEWWYESLTFKLAADCRYTPDFCVVLASGELEVHEVKGRRKGQGGQYWAEDDAKVKFRVCARTFPFRLRVVWPDGAGGFHDTEIREAA
jgi:hypothetical protein